MENGRSWQADETTTDFSASSSQKGGTTSYNLRHDFEYIQFAQ